MEMQRELFMFDFPPCGPSLWSQTSDVCADTQLGLANAHACYYLLTLKGPGGVAAW